MVTFRPARPGRLADVPAFDRGIGGAESNVACTLARAGHTARWISRVGDDGFGEYLTREIARCGVDTSAVRRDPGRPTGIYFRTAGERATCAAPASATGDATTGDATIGDAVTANAAPANAAPANAAPGEPLAEVAYYRAGSAASAMSPANTPVGADARILHLSGITAALSPDCLALMRELTTRRPGRPLVSFDVNYRVSLWPDPTTAGATLADLARGADLVFVGEDEAEAAWGITGGPAAIRAALPEPGTLVVKQGSTGATVFHREPSAGLTVEERRSSARPQAAEAADRDLTVHVPALTVDVVAAVGAGDAFAAGFLSATLRELPAAQRLRTGHLWAAAALTVAGDMAAPPSRAHADHLAELPDEDWCTLRLGPGWTTTGTKGEVITT
ncbi:sugar kinase [Streptomyces sp. TRM66268-LWL]|uniref:Sugar kinase n=2 Tax=Streptomyces polyasparticus TaxID=2767826 RepID=A0ABR7SQ97_9ACTN|nr:sugar kinase [Streptomyces polyasparticus]